MIKLKRQQSIYTLGISATKFTDISNKQNKTTGLFKYFTNDNHSASTMSKCNTNDKCMDECIN